MSEMKKIIIIDGGPRRNMNTAQMPQKFAEGAQSAGEHIEVKTIRLYDLDYKEFEFCESNILQQCNQHHESKQPITGIETNLCRHLNFMTAVNSFAPILKK